MPGPSSWAAAWILLGVVQGRAVPGGPRGSSGDKSVEASGPGTPTAGTLKVLVLPTRAHCHLLAIIRRRSGRQSASATGAAAVVPIKALEVSVSIKILVRRFRNHGAFISCMMH